MAVPAKVTLTCFFALVGLAVFVLGTALSPAQAQYPGGGYPGGGYPGTTGTGHYDVSYSVTAGSGSTATYTTSGYPGSGASVSATDSKSCYTSYGSSPTTYHIAANSALTATFTWNNENNLANLPPSCAVITQGSSASWSAQAQGCVPTGDCDPGLPNPVYTSGYLSKSGTATLYTVKSGSGGLSSITLAPVTPTASSDGTSGSAGGSGASGTVSVSYTASATPVTVQLTGRNSSYQALVGQQITAQVVTGIGTVVSNNWAATGSVFKSYNENFTSNQKVALSSDNGDYTGSKFYFYDVTGGDSVVVTCYANIKLPDGNIQNVAVAAQSVTFLKPSTMWRVKEGFIQPFTSPQYPGSLLYGLGPDPATVTTYPDGEDWYPVDITMPVGFSQAGQCGFVQLVTPNYTQTHNGSTTGGPKPQGLDNTFAFGQWTLPGQGNAGDNPSFITNTSNNALFVAGDQQAFNDQFTTYVMFRPPAVGNQETIWAPLQSYNWSAKTTITYNGSQWNIVPAQSAPMTPSALAIKGTDTNTPPQWSVSYTNGQ